MKTDRYVIVYGMKTPIGLWCPAVFVPLFLVLPCQRALLTTPLNLSKRFLFLTVVDYLQSVVD